MSGSASHSENNSVYLGVAKKEFLNHGRSDIRGLTLLYSKQCKVK